MPIHPFHTENEGFSFQYNNDVFSSYFLQVAVAVICLTDATYNSWLI